MTQRRKSAGSVISIAIPPRRKYPLTSHSLTFPKVAPAPLHSRRSLCAVNARSLAGDQSVGIQNASLIIKIEQFRRVSPMGSFARLLGRSLFIKALESKKNARKNRVSQNPSVLILTYFSSPSTHTRSTLFVRWGRARG
jgi:hypothetical protein